MEGINYKMGWVIVAFDLPVGSADQRKAAADFRNFLLGDGFLMLQYSVYARSMVSYARMETHLRRLKQNLPPEGSVRAIFVTQAQWDKSFIIHGSPSRQEPPEEQNEQLLFW